MTSPPPPRPPTAARIALPRETAAVRMPTLLADRASLYSSLLLHRYDDLRMVGIDPRSSGWKRLRKGVYVDRTAYERLPPWTRYEVRVHAFLFSCTQAGAGELSTGQGVCVDKKQYWALKDWQRYAVRVHAYLRLNPDAILCLESAGVIHGIPQFGECTFIHVYDPRMLLLSRMHCRSRPRRASAALSSCGADTRRLNCSVSSVMRGTSTVPAMLATLRSRSRAKPWRPPTHETESPA